MIIYRTKWAVDYDASFRKSKNVVNADVYKSSLRKVMNMTKDIKQPLCEVNWANERFLGRFFDPERHKHDIVPE